jgi:hypothetical protein
VTQDPADAEATGYYLGKAWCLRCDVSVDWGKPCWFCGKDDELYKRDQTRETAFIRLEG